MQNKEGGKNWIALVKLIQAGASRIFFLHFFNGNSTSTLQYLDPRYRIVSPWIWKRILHPLPDSLGQISYESNWGSTTNLVNDSQP